MITPAPRRRAATLIALAEGAHRRGGAVHAAHPDPRCPPRPAAGPLGAARRGPGGGPRPARAAHAAARPGAGADRDGDPARSVSTYADQTRRSRDAISEVRGAVAASEERAQRAAVAARAVKAGLERQASGVAKLLGGRRALLDDVRGDRSEIEAEARDLQARSSKLAATIRAAQGLPPAPSGAVAVGPPSSAGLVRPADDTITSGFGMRWGRMHEGIDIAGTAGTPIAAAAAGTVIVAGWSGGYGNLVVIDHGSGISTAYAHNSSLAVTVGQTVGQGTVVAGMGTTGHSTGVHCHFEVRVSGAAVNPLDYL